MKQFGKLVHGYFIREDDAFYEKASDDSSSEGSDVEDEAFLDYTEIVMGGTVVKSETPKARIGLFTT